MVGHDVVLFYLYYVLAGGSRKRSHRGFCGHFEGFAPTDAVPRP